MSPPPLFSMDDEPMETPTGSPRNSSISADLDFQTAVAVSMDELDVLSIGDSLEEFGRSPNRDQTPLLGPATQQSAQERLRVYQDVAQYALEKRIELPLLNFVDADTLVFIDPPPVTRKDREAAEDGRGSRLAPVDCAPHRMHSERLKATGSTYFINALGPTKQFRTVRRRRLTGLPPGIKHVIDLTPPEEGDVAVDLTTELSCSNGVRQWFFTEQRWEIPASLVGGHDDFEEKNIVAQARLPNLLAQTRDGITPERKRGKAPIPMDYTAVRHHSAIERVLNIIEGLPPRIDSAPKMWSVFCVAKFLDCASVVKDDVLSWIYGERNERFIEALPEVALKVAEGLQNYMLCRDAFSVLVGEEALASVGKEIFGGNFWASRARRGREGLDLDSFVTRVEYASKAFAERVNTTFTQLVDANWITETPEYRRISAFFDSHSTDGCDAINKLTKYLRGFIRTRIYSVLSVLSRISANFPSAAPNGRVGESLFSYSSHTGVYGGINHKEALLIRDYWMPLMSESLLAQNPPSTRTDPYVPVFGITCGPRRTDWSELLAETERFNWLVTEMATKINASLTAAAGPMDNPQGVPGPTKSDSGSSTQLKAGGTNRLPIRPKYGHNLPVPEAPSATGMQNLPIRPKSWVQCLTPSIVLGIGSSGSSGYIPVRREAEGPLPPKFGEWSTVDPWDIVTTGKVKRDSGDIPDTRGETLRDLKPQLTPVQDDASRKRPSLDCIADNTGYRACGGVNYPFNNPLHFHPFNLHTFLGECQRHIVTVVGSIIKPSISFDPAITDTLLSLDENEFKYLPLYAGGNDDGSGGVFDEPIPNAVTGPIGPGPKYHIGMGSAASSSFDMVDAGSVGSSSFDTSMGVEDGYSDHLDRRHVYSDDGMSAFDAKGKGKGKGEEIDDYDDVGGEEETVMGHGSDSEGEEFYDVEDDLMLFT
ncbi:MAG: hypothetical protein M1839_005855 [Geoglossum umbratile]|nr:MAG: hypothetical protein M1839_005855 [Geoglossum umbratile]